MKKKIIDFLLKKFTDYYFIKNSHKELLLENKKLKENIYTLVMKQNTEESLILEIGYKMEFDLQRSIEISFENKLQNTFTGLGH